MRKTKAARPNPAGKHGKPISRKGRKPQPQPKSKATKKAAKKKPTRKRVYPKNRVPDRSPTIMVVDDDDDIRFMMSEVLRKDGYSVTEAASAKEAEQKALQEVPHLILLDINMPGTDGMSVLWNIRKRQEIAEVPVVIVSAYDAFDLRAEAAAAGCRGYITKPLAVEELREVVRSIVEKSA
jgi:CheY-like chemotaxis protein